MAFEVSAADLATALKGLLTSGVGGVSVTTPHKQAACDVADRLTPAAAELGAVNCLWRIDGETVGDSTDGDGLVTSLSHDGVSLAGRSVAVLGAGGAARSIIRSVAAAGAREVMVVNRSPERATVAARLAGAVGRVAEAGDTGSADVIVNATPVGMGYDRTVPLDPAVLHSGQVVVDAVYHPPSDRPPCRR